MSEINKIKAAIYRDCAERASMYSRETKLTSEEITREYSKGFFDGMITAETSISIAFNRIADELEKDGQ
jgi:hypothetical protein